MTNRQEKIRPPTHSTLQPSPVDIREEAERDLRETVRMPDPGARADADGAVNAGVAPVHRYVGGPAELGGVALDASSPSPPPGSAWPDMPPGARPFTPAETVELRRHMNDPNRMGQPRQNTSAEQLLIQYQAALKVFRDDYAGTRSTRFERQFLEAKQAMIDAGLMKGDV